MYLHPMLISSLRQGSLRLRPCYLLAKGPHTGSDTKPGLDNSENSNNWSVALSGTERSPRSASPQPIHCTNRDPSDREWEGRFIITLDVLCQVGTQFSVIAVSARSNYWCSLFFSRNSFCGHLQGTQRDCADVTVIQVRVSNTDCCITSQTLILTLKPVPADLSAVTVAAALKQDIPDSLFRTLS